MGSSSLPADLEVWSVRAAAPEMVLVAFTPADDALLTTVECEVAIAAASGLSNGQIAAGRGVAMRTVANQIASVFTKLGIASRAELAARLTVEHLR